jgi:hypothetical protein
MMAYISRPETCTTPVYLQHQYNDLLLLLVHETAKAHDDLGERAENAKKEDVQIYYTFTFVNEKRIWPWKLFETFSSKEKRAQKT